MDDGSRSEVRGFRNFEPGTSNLGLRLSARLASLAHESRATKIKTVAVRKTIRGYDAQLRVGPYPTRPS